MSKRKRVIQVVERWAWNSAIPVMEWKRQFLQTTIHSEQRGVSDRKVRVTVEEI